MEALNSRFDIPLEAILKNRFKRRSDHFAAVLVNCGATDAARSLLKLAWTETYFIRVSKYLYIQKRGKYAGPLSSETPTDNIIFRWPLVFVVLGNKDCLRAEKNCPGNDNR